MTIFKTARLKIKRADEHIAEADRIITGFRSPQLQIVTHEIDPQTGNQSLHYNLKSSVTFDDLALVIGDAVHNLKTAIDHGWHILLSAFAPALARSKHSKFPVESTTKQQLENRLRGVEMDTINLALFRFVVEDLRPYGEGGNGAICTIHDLDIRDKHKLLLPLARVTAVVGAVLEDEAGKSTENAILGTMNEVLPITIPFPAKFKVKNYGSLMFEVVLEQRSLVQFITASATLHHLREVTLGTVEAMEGFFARTR